MNLFTEGESYKIAGRLMNGQLSPRIFLLSFEPEIAKLSKKRAEEVEDAAHALNKLYTEIKILKKHRSVKNALRCLAKFIKEIEK